MKYKIIILAIFALMSPLFANSITRAINDIQGEMSKREFLVENKKIKPYMSTFKQLEDLSKDLYEREDDSRFRYLDKLLKIGKRVDSVIVYQYIIYEASRFIDIRNKALFEKYISGAALKLYSKKMCDGFLFTGMFKELHESKNLEAVQIYKDGEKTCKIKWKNMELLSRENRLKYKMGYFKK